MERDRKGRFAGKKKMAAAAAAAAAAAEAEAAQVGEQPEDSRPSDMSSYSTEPHSPRLEGGDGMDCDTYVTSSPCSSFPYPEKQRSASEDSALSVMTARQRDTGIAEPQVALLEFGPVQAPIPLPGVMASPTFADELVKYDHPDYSLGVGGEAAQGVRPQPFEQWFMAPAYPVAFEGDFGQPEDI